MQNQSNHEITLDTQLKTALSTAVFSSGQPAMMVGNASVRKMAMKITSKKKTVLKIACFFFPRISLHLLFMWVAGMARLWVNSPLTNVAQVQRVNAVCGLSLLLVLLRFSSLHKNQQRSENSWSESHLGDSTEIPIYLFIYFKFISLFQEKHETKGIRRLSMLFGSKQKVQLLPALDPGCNISNTRKVFHRHIQTPLSGLKKNELQPIFNNRLQGNWTSDETPFSLFDIDGFHSRDLQFYGTQMTKATTAMLVHITKEVH